MPFIGPDEARIEALIDPGRRRALVAHVDAAVARHAADPFEAALFYLTVGLRDRADALLQSQHASFVTAGLDRNDPRYIALARTFNASR